MTNSGDNVSVSEGVSTSITKEDLCSLNRGPLVEILQ